jgi:hypothetical protein
MLTYIRLCIPYACISIFYSHQLFANGKNLRNIENATEPIITIANKKYNLDSKLFSGQKYYGGRNSHHQSQRHGKYEDYANTMPMIYFLDLPESITSLIINVGSNLDPPMPPENNKSIAVIAVEPILRTAARIPVHERLYTIVCAIANTPRFQIMNTYNAGGLSSSLSPLANEGAWFKTYTDVDPRKGLGAKKNPDFVEAKTKHQGSFQIVPVLPLSMLLDSIPAHLEILDLHTDMQGYDFMAIMSAGRSLLRVHRLQTEVWLKHPVYKGVNNSFEDDWKPYMTSLGYRVDKVVGMGDEADVFWSLI